MTRSKPTYIWQRKNWPDFTWQQEKFTPQLSDLRHNQGRLLGRMEALGFPLRAEATLQTLTEDVVKSSAIEGEILDQKQVRSSLARRMGMEGSALGKVDRHVEGIVSMLLDATEAYEKPLTKERLFGWHTSLFPAGRSGTRKLVAGAWRNDKSGPMRVISGPMGRERIHYEAPPASRLTREMKVFMEWFNAPQSIDPVLKAAIAHFWFVTIHPFDDGNGRIARAIADMALARSENSPRRFYSMSAQIRAERNVYYNMLEAAQKGSLDITLWLEWFLACLGRAIAGAEGALASVLDKARFWEVQHGEVFNDRQREMLNRLLDGFAGKLTSTKWALITKCSQDTAARDINDLIQRDILKKDEAGGRSTSYSLSEVK
jgi:Fic family protein